MVKLAGAPISWGVCEVPDWGLQLSPSRVLAEMRSLGLGATEAGPPGFLPEDPARARELLGELSMVGGFVTAVLHDPARREAELEAVDHQAAWLASLGAEVLVLAAASGGAGYDASSRVDAAGWKALFATLEGVAQIAARHRLELAVHPHWGTVVERAEDVARFLDGCDKPLCLDTGHVALGGADPLEIARRAPDRVRHVHLKDVDPDLATAVRDGDLAYGPAVRRGLYRELGQGCARVADVVRSLSSRGYAGWYVLEQDVMLVEAPAGIPPWIERSAAFARAHG